MSHPRKRASDPVKWCALLAVCFVLLCAIRIMIPSEPYFDEVHYVPAARALLEQRQWLNQEHPMMGKELMALSIAVLGDNAIGWRMLSLLAGGGALYAFMRAVWFGTRTRFAPLASGILLASGFQLFVHSRIAMLDIFMVAFFALAMWQCAAAVRQPETGRLRLAIAGVALGLSMASKWNVVPLVPLPGVTFLIWRASTTGWRFATSQRGAPVPGITLAEAFLWLGIVPLLVYTLSYSPALFLPDSPLEQIGLPEQHRIMIQLQESVTQTHPYQSGWQQWALNTRAIWYLYEFTDGAQRGIVLIGNPLTMLAGLPAMLWCAYAGLWKGRRDALSIFILYSVSFGFWIIAAKPVQFYYHYFLPSCFLLIGLALALDAIWRMGNRWFPLALLTLSMIVFALFYPILSAAPLAGPTSFEHWMLLNGWR
ncbi:MAG: glycosyltransferase family 39 protein [Sphingomonadaceae bacterium]